MGEMWRGGRRAMGDAECRQNRRLRYIEDGNKKLGCEKIGDEDDSNGGEVGGGGRASGDVYSCDTRC